MTAETLKPFITPSSAESNFPLKPSSQRKIKLLIPIVLGIIALTLVTGIFALTIWQTLRVQELEKDVITVKKELENLRQRLGIGYLEDLAEFQNEYTNLLAGEADNDVEADEEDDDDMEETWLSADDNDDDADADADNDDDDDDDEEEDDNESNEKMYEDYTDLIKQEMSAATQDSQDEEAKPTSSAAATVFTFAASNDGNVFDDFTHYNDSKKKRERKSRSITELHNELQSNDLTQQIKQNQTKLLNQTKLDAPEAARKLRIRTRKGRQHVLLRRGESPVSAKSTDFNANEAATKPAVHFHLNRKVAHHNAPIQLNSYQGDMYIGHATASNDNRWQEHFTVHNGVLTVHQSGLYYVYAQICYNNTHDQNGFIIFHGHNAFLQCLNTVPTSMPQKVHTCHTSGLIQLEANDSIHLRDIHRDRNVMLRDANNRSYFGILKV